MFKELDMVVLTKDVAQVGLKRCDVGAVVHCYDSGDGFESGERGCLCFYAFLANIYRFPPKVW